MKRLKILLLSVLLLSFSNAYSWGFLAHRNINRYAVYILPEPMIGFYKNHIEYLSEHAIDPDKRSQVSHDEAVKHYIDIDIYGENPFELMPREWKDAKEKFTEDTLKEYGILPWNIKWVFGNLVNAFKSKDVDRILYISASFGHYIADATVPLHTTQYYDGKEMRQKGIHAFWETRMVELFLDDWDFFVGKAEYIKDPLGQAWDLVEQSHAGVDTIFDAEINLRTLFPEDKKFVIDQKYSGNKAQISKEYGVSFNAYTKFMVERQFKVAIKMVASFWYSAWVNAGQPDLTSLEDVKISAKHQAELDEIDRQFQDAYNGEEHIY